jgi:hypothetical protein
MSDGVTLASLRVYAEENKPHRYPEEILVSRYRKALRVQVIPKTWST